VPCGPVHARTVLSPVLSSAQKKCLFARRFYSCRAHFDVAGHRKPRGYSAGHGRLGGDPADAVPQPVCTPRGRKREPGRRPLPRRLQPHDRRPPPRTRAVGEVEAVAAARPGEDEAPAARLGQVDDRGPWTAGDDATDRCANRRRGLHPLRADPERGRRGGDRPRHPEDLVAPVSCRRRAERVAEEDRGDAPGATERVRDAWPRAGEAPRAQIGSTPRLTSAWHATASGRAATEAAVESRHPVCAAATVARTHPIRRQSTAGIRDTARF
jgi:hypothetical protein